MMSFIRAANNIFWGWLIAALLLGTGIYYSIRLGFPQVKHFKRMFKLMMAESGEKGGISSFQSLCTALGGQVGSGNIVGVATAIASGGYGAVFWMWVTAILGMPLMVGEGILAQVFRVKREDGTYTGGPAYYLEKGVKQKWLAVMFAISIIFGPGLVNMTVHSNSITTSCIQVFSIPPMVVGIALFLLTAAVVIGGIKRIAEVASYVVPFMAIGYLLIAGYTVAANISLFPKAIGLIIKSAFSSSAVAGGAMGFTVKQAFRYGVARGLFSNEAGQGTVANVYATASVKHPAQQGIAAMVTVFIDTIIICTATALMIITTGAIESGTTGAALVQIATTSVTGNFGHIFILLSLLFFGWTTMLVCVYMGEVNLEWLFPNNKWIIKVFRLVSCSMLIVGSVLTVPTVWELLDFTNALMTFCNTIALLCLVNLVAKTLKDYEEQLKNGVEIPAWDWNKSSLD